ncbi:MAG: (2Fe-2S)-binding protein, partial [Candidatus Cloacimonadota bacterium]|nr:(2Fe-2S)-binding protein [Candidatus Cloacimonadota bacterium]
VGLVEAMPRCGGYKVHADKLRRLGVPIYTSHTVAEADGDETIESVTIAQIDDNFNIKKGTEKTFKCDTLLIAVGLEPVNEFAYEAEKANIPVYSAGDALEIAEASSAMFNGKIAGLRVAQSFGGETKEVPDSWYEKAEILKSPAGKIYDYDLPKEETGVMPIIHCLQEIPCNPCTTICPTNSIKIKEDNLMGLPKYVGGCIGCGKCVAICPGLAITLVDYRNDSENPIVTVPYEVMNHSVKVGDKIPAVDIEGKFLAELEIFNITPVKNNKTHLIRLKSPKEIAKKIVSFSIQNKEVSKPLKKKVIMPDEEMVCVCERVSAGEVRKLIKKGITDLNQIKAITRAGMGPCGSKTCDNLLKQLIREEGIPMNEVVENVRRPLFVEVPLVKFFDGKHGGEK